MSETKFTPGPWSADVQGVIETRDGIIIAEVEAEANAHLIAAAPELYEALHEITDAYWGVDDDHAGDGGEPPACIVRARTALSQARGEK